jgi:iron(III) transport system ATP-binding protein
MEILKPKLSVRNLCKSYDGKVVFKDLSFDLMEGEFLSILGPSGCGKTTLLRILIGLEKADGGEILKNGADISSLSSAQRGMGIVFQNYALFPNMTVLQNVQYALTLRKDTKKQAREIALRTLEQVGLTDQMNKKPAQLSGGQQQRVAIARTLAMNPDIILLDEPISALDVANREIMKAELKALQKKFKATMLFITHDQEEAFFLSDRVMVMNNGTIEQMDTPLTIYQKPANDYVSTFVVEQLDKKYQDLLRYTGRSGHDE